MKWLFFLLSLVFFPVTYSTVDYLYRFHPELLVIDVGGIPYMVFVLLFVVIAHVLGHAGARLQGGFWSMQAVHFLVGWAVVQFVIEEQHIYWFKPFGAMVNYMALILLFVLYQSMVRHVTIQNRKEKEEDEVLLRQDSEE